MWELRKDTCEGCGHPISQAWSKEADKSNWRGSHYYQVPGPVRCHACTEIDIARSAATNDNPSALHFIAARVDRRG